MLMCEFLTAVHHKLLVKVVIYNNSAFGLIPLEAEAAGFIEVGDEMVAAGTGGAGTHRELAGELGLAGGGQRRSFLMTDANPLDAASSNRVGEWIQGVADQCEICFTPICSSTPTNRSATVCDTCRSDGLRRHVLCGQAY